MEGINHLDTMWVIIGGALVFFMNAGFALVESGLCRSKNAVNILTKNLIVFGLAVVGFWSVGYALMFGGSHSFIGSTGFFLTGLDPLTGGEGHKVPLNGFFFFQLCFAATAATIVSGAVAERIKIQSFMVFSVVLTAVVYPIIGHWVWGGGWLAKKGFADFAGSTVVHSVGGWAALVGAAMLGPRIGKYSKDGKVQPIAGHNMSMVTLGGLVLMLGWFGFNAGSTLTADGMAISHIVTTTTLGGAMGMVAAALWAWLRMGKPDLTLIVNGMLAGLVGVTAGCAFIEPYSAAIIGGLAAVLAIEAVMFFDRLKIDDPVGATSVHLAGGIFGTLAVGLFGRKSLGMANEGLLFGGGGTQLWIQLQGVAATGALVITASLVTWFVIKKTLGMRVTPEEESIGLDASEMGLEAYPADRPSLSVAAETPAKGTAVVAPATEAT